MSINIYIETYFINPTTNIHSFKTKFDVRMHVRVCKFFQDQLIATTPVSGGMGMHLLQKMGWKPGEGLGKEKNGSLQPLLLEVKLDKKGLVAEEEVKKIV